MTPTIYRYRFDREVPLSDVEESLLLAVLAAEGLHGAASVDMDSASRLDKDPMRCVIDATTRVGRDIARIFTCFLIHEFGRDAFTVDALAPAGLSSREVRS
jgi:hypothetical protein